MLSYAETERVQELVGHRGVKGEWCKIREIPEPPPAVHVAAGGGPLCPGALSPFQHILRVAKWIALIPFAVLGVLYGLIDHAPSLASGLRSKDGIGPIRRARSRVADSEKALADHGLDQAFDGDWQKEAGQFLLRYYAQSAYPERLVILAPGSIFFLAPLKRVSFGRRKKMEMLVEFRVGQAVIENPLLSEYETEELRLRFADDSWFVLIASDVSNELNMMLEIVRENGNRNGYPVDAG